MATATQVTVEGYLRTSYDPDCEYVDGEVLERNVGEKGHGKVEKRLTVYLARHEAAWGVFALQEWRVQLGGNHYRVPDICVVAGPEPAEENLTSPPLVCIEVLSPGDRMQRRIADYLTFGVQYVWILNPQAKDATAYTETGVQLIKDGFLRTENPTIEVPLNEVFD